MGRASYLFNVQEKTRETPNKNCMKQTMKQPLHPSQHINLE